MSACPYSWFDVVRHYCNRNRQMHTFHTCSCGALHDEGTPIEHPGATITAQRARPLSRGYWCAVCQTDIADDEERHTLPDGEDCHEACCPVCKENDDD